MGTDSNRHGIHEKKIAKQFVFYGYYLFKRMPMENNSNNKKPSPIGCQYELTNTISEEPTSFFQLYYTKSQIGMKWWDDKIVALH